MFPVLLLSTVEFKESPELGLDMGGHLPEQESILLIGVGDGAYLP
jgi:hypothetical protein